MSTETPVKPIITKHSSEFKLDAYASTPTMELVVFAVQVLQADGAPVAVEEIVSTCFRFFPHSFALKNYFYWPDSALVSRRLQDAKEKGLLKGSSSEGFETKGKGKQVAKQVAKGLGVSLPEPPKVEAAIAPVAETKKEEEKKEAPKAVEKKEPKKQITSKKNVKPATKSLVKKTQKKKEEKKRVKSEKKVLPTVKQVTPKVVEKPEAKKRVTSKKNVQPVVKPLVKKAEPKVVEKQVIKKQDASNKKKAQPVAKLDVKKPEPKVEKKKEAQTQNQPTQLTMPLTPATAWKKAETPATKPKVQKEAPQVVKGEVLPVVAASKEEKDKAAKVIKQVERSDAYQLYRRNGRRAQIGEFDFRNMLFATMESSPETLKRNVDLFKRYAGIHFRADLITFFEFCEETFKSLLVAKVKGKK